MHSKFIVHFAVIIAVLFFSQNSAVESDSSETGSSGSGSSESGSSENNLKNCTDDSPVADCKFSINDLLSCNGKPIDATNQLYVVYGHNVASPCLKYFFFDVNKEGTSGKINFTIISNGASFITSIDQSKGPECGEYVLKDLNNQNFLETKILLNTAECSDDEACTFAGFYCEDGCISFTDVVSTDPTGKSAKKCLEKANNILKNFKGCTTKTAAISDTNLQENCNSSGKKSRRNLLNSFTRFYAP